MPLLLDIIHLEIFNPYLYFCKMINEIRRLEEISRKLEVPSSKRLVLDKVVQEYAHQFIDNLEEGKANRIDEEKGIGILDYGIDEIPLSIEKIVEGFDKHLIHSGINAASGGHMGYIPGGGLYPSSIADYLVDITNRYAGIFYAAPGAVRLENMLIRWMCDLVGFPKSAFGNLTSGGSISILIAVVTARDSAKLKSKDFDKAVVYLTEQTHHALHKALRIAGLGDCQIRQIAMDDYLRMNPEALDNQIRLDIQKGLNPFFINASIGTTNTGAVDPIEDIGEIAKKYKIWYQVDAAYGGFFKLVKSMEHLFVGLDLADSITLDPHKSLFLPFGTGAILIKDTEALFASHHYQAEYMQDMNIEGREISPADVSPELTKHFRGLRMWLPMKLFGLNSFRSALEEKMLLTQYVHAELRKIKGIDVGPPPELSVTMFRYVLSVDDPNEFNKGLILAIQKDGRVFLSSTKIKDVFWIRVCILSFRTHLDRVDLLLEIIKEKIEELRKELN